MARKVISEIVKEIQESKYFSIIVDSTPDITHKDQLSFIIRYVSKEGTPKERFLRFIKNPVHTGKELAETVMSFLKANELDISSCRGQTYDNAANMSGIYSGLQTRIKEVNHLAYFIPCSAHFLSLVGSSAATCCKQAFFFLLCFRIFINFSRSLRIVGVS